MQFCKPFRQRVLPVAIGAILAVGFADAGAHPGTIPATESAPVQPAANTAQSSQDSTGQKQTPRQASNPTELQAVVVTGIRASLQSAENRKRHAPQIMESIVAQNIGKLPDTNAADALSRITGIQVTRDQGEGSGITIRGLTQIATHLNGNTVFTASGSRTLNFEDIPAGLLAGVDVYKAPTASQIEGGIGGTINLRTHRPFDFDGFKATATVGATYGSMIDKAKPKFSGLISDTWDTGIGKVGALLAVSYQNRPYASKSTGLNPTNTSTGSFDVNGDGNTDANDVLLYPPGIYYEYAHGNRRRLGINGSLQWRPTDKLEFYLDAYVARFKSIGNYNSVYVDSSAGSALNVSNLYAGTATIEDFTLFPGTSDMLSATFSDATATPQSFSQDFNNKTYNLSLGSRWHHGGLTLDANVHYAKGTHTSQFNELDLHGTIPLFSMDVAPTQPVLDYHGYDLSNPDNFTYGAIYWSHRHNVGKLKSLKLDAIYDTANEFWHTFKFGYRYAERTATNDANSLYVDSIPGPGNMFGQPVSSIPGLVTNKPTAIGWAVTPDANQLRNVAELFGKFNLGPVPGANPLQTYDLSERSDAIYAAAVFSAYGAVPVDGNIGVRVVRTRDSVNGVLSVDGAYTPLNKRSSYTDVLPSLNLTMHLTDSLQWRFAASKTMARPSFSQLTPSVFLNGLQRTGSAGNPDLEPMKAIGYDTALAWYFSEGSYIFGDIFYKKVSNSVAYTDTIQSFDGVDYRIQMPTNANQGKLQGIELGYQQFFHGLPGWLGGFGIKANYTYVDSSANGILQGQKTSLPDLSKNSYNLILLYDYSKFWGRIAYNWRNGYFQNTRATALGTMPVYKKPFGILDASIGYTINEHLALSLDGVNLNNSQKQSYYLRQTLPNELRWDDRRVEVNLRVTF